MAFVFDCPICGKSTGTFMRIGEHCKCKHCGSDVIVPPNAEKTADLSLSCDQSLGQSQSVSSGNPISANSSANQNLVKLVRNAAWIVSVLAFFTNLFMFSTIPAEAGGMKYFIILTGVGTSLMIWASFMVVAQILEDLRAIRDHLEQKSKN